MNSGLKFHRAHTREHHLIQYPPSKFLNSIELGSSIPNAYFYFPALLIPGIFTYYYLQSSWYVFWSVLFIVVNLSVVGKNISRL